MELIAAQDEKMRMAAERVQKERAWLEGELHHRTSEWMQKAFRCQEVKRARIDAGAAVIEEKGRIAEELRDERAARSMALKLGGASRQRELQAAQQRDRESAHQMTLQDAEDAIAAMADMAERRQLASRERQAGYAAASLTAEARKSAVRQQAQSEAQGLASLVTGHALGPGSAVADAAAGLFPRSAGRLAKLHSHAAQAHRKKEGRKRALHEQQRQRQLAEKIEQAQAKWLD